MADEKQVHDFAEKWLTKFKSDQTNYLELVEHFMADDCRALGFEMDCGHAFEERYGTAAHDHKALEHIIADVADIPLLGSAIYSRWRYFNHWAYSGAEIMEQENRAWFIIALERLAELSSGSSAAEYVVMLLPEIGTLKAEIEKLRTEMSMLLLERDELRFVHCKNIETQYMMELGGLEYKAFELHCAMLRLKRKMDLIQAKKNRQERVIISAIEKTLDLEFAEYQKKLDEQIEKMNAALERSKGEVLSDEDTKELKSLYRTVVKALHPDLHPDISEAQINLFHNAVTAYENGDLRSMRIIKEMVAEPAIPVENKNGIEALTEERDRLKKTLELIKDQIADVKNSYPHNLKSILRDKEKLAEKKADLEETISRLKELIETYKFRLRTMIGAQNE